MAVQFPIAVRWRGGDLSFAAAHGNVLRVAVPPVLGGSGGYWSPEELLVGAAATCFVLALAATAEREELPLLDATLEAGGTLADRFTQLRIDASIETLPGCEEAVRAAAESAALRCPVLDALDLPVAIQIRVHAVEPAAHPASR